MGQSPSGEAAQSEARPRALFGHAGGSTLRGCWAAMGPEQLALLTIAA